MVFDVILINIGNGYNKISGAFTCPVHGIYSFTLNFMTHHEDNSAFGIYVNDDRLCTAFQSSSSGMASCSAMTELQKDDVVNVKALYSSSLYPVDRYYKGQNALVGFLYKSL